MKNRNLITSIFVFLAPIFLFGQSVVGVVTDIEGNYSIKESPSLQATLNVSYVGHTLDSKEIIQYFDHILLA